MISITKMLKFFSKPKNWKTFFTHVRAIYIANKKREYARAIQLYQNIIASEPEDRLMYNAYRDLGETYWWNGQIEEAQNALRKALDYKMKTKGHDPYLYKLLGDMAIKNDEYVEALQFYEKVAQFGSKGFINKMLLDMDEIQEVIDRLEEQKEDLPFITAYYKQNKERLHRKWQNSEIEESPDATT